MKQSLLEITQHILDAMDSDEVNSISDTTESMQIARLIRGVFYDCASELNLAVHEGVFKLEPSLDPAQPVVMYLPNNVSMMYWVKYDNKDQLDVHSNYQDLYHMDFNDFFEKQNYLNSEDANVEELVMSINSEPYQLKYLTDEMPTCYTSLSNTMLLFNSYDQSEDTTLQKAKTLCGGLIYPEFLLEDTFVAPLEIHQFSYFVNKAKTRAFYELKQVENRESAGEYRLQKISIQRNKPTIPGESALQKQKRLTGYGRRI